MNSTSLYRNREGQIGMKVQIESSFWRSRIIFTEKKRRVSLTATSVPAVVKKGFKKKAKDLYDQYRKKIRTMLFLEISASSSALLFQYQLPKNLFFPINQE